MPRTKRSLAERFQGKFIVNKKNGCWEWQAARNKKGYGLIGDENGRDGRTLLAHRVSYELFVGPIPSGLLVMHKCDNPRCVNPEHLKVGTAQENSNDMVDKGRQPGINQSKFSITDLKTIFEFHKKVHAGTNEKDTFLASWFSSSREHIRDIRLGKRLGRSTEDLRKWLQKTS